MKKSTRTLIAAALASLIMMCTSPAPIHVAEGGNGSDVEASVVGEVLRPDATPAAQARVFLRSRGYLAPTPGESRYPGLLIDTMTDATGQFVIYGVPSGSYLIEVTDSRGFATLFSCTVRSGDTLVNLGGDTLRPQALVTGTVPLSGSSEVIVHIPGLERSSIIDSSRTFALHVPRGSFALAISDRITNRSLTLSEVAAHSGCTTIVGPIDLANACENFACDSLILSDILAANGLSPAIMHSVSRRDSSSGRVLELTLEGMGLRVIPPSVGKLTDLRRLRIRRNSGLQSIPRSIGNLKQLRELSLDMNDIRSLPAELGYLPSLQVLTIWGNQLDSLPFTIGNLIDLRVIIAGKNRISGLPSSMEKLRALETLDLGGNLLASLPAEIAHLDHLRELDLERNSLSVIPEQLFTMPALRKLSISFNMLCNLPAAHQAWLDQRDSDWRRTQYCGSPGS